MLRQSLATYRAGSKGWGSRSRECKSLSAKPNISRQVTPTGKSIEHCVFALALFDRSDAAALFVRRTIEPQYALNHAHSFFHKADASKIVQKQTFGQPTWRTHPELVKECETTPGLSKMEYELRRTKLMASLPYNSVVVCMGYKTRYMSQRVFYPFHQNTDFYYLTGFNEPDSAVLLEHDNSERGYKMTMFVPPKNAEAELWDGPRTGLEGVKEMFDADEAFESSRFLYRLKDILDKYQHVFIDMPPTAPSILSKEFLKRLTEDRAVKPPESIRPQFSFWPTSRTEQTISSLSPLIQELRLIKSPAEAALMRKSGEISAKSFIQTMKFTDPSKSEHQLWAKLDYECRMRGSSMLAYVPVVAGGKNALSMHYVRNDMPLRDGDLVLLDGGGEYAGYASDITRTWPVNGTFSSAQKQLYQAVLNVQKECIKMCTERSRMSLHDIHDQSMRLMRAELKRIQFPLVEGDLDRKLYPHHVGHYLGMDVHDCPDVDRSRPLKEGMVVTIEPGLYIPPDPAYPEQYHGIGIRIEDNVLVGKDDPIVLSATAPKEIVDIEFCCNT